MSSDNSITRPKVPHRPHGNKVQNQNLPPTLPIVGLGCSNLSSFFLPTQEPTKYRSKDQVPITRSSISRDHKIVVQWISAIHHAILDCGITLLDTAPWYGHGVSEIVIGYALQDILSPAETSNGTNMNANNDNTRSIPRSSLIVNTKVGRYEMDKLYQFDFSHSKTITSVQKSIERMNCRYVDVLQLHDPEFSPSLEVLMTETIPAMLKCRDELKIVRALGITGYPLEVQYDILRLSMEMGYGDGVVFDQSLTYGHFNLHDISLFCKPLASNDDDKNDTGPNNTTTTFATYCHSKGIPICAAAPLSMGLLKDTPPPSWHPASQILMDACVNASQIASEHGVNLATLATVFALSHSDISCTLIGMSSIKEVECGYDAAMRFGKVKGEEGVKVLEEGGRCCISQDSDEEFMLVLKEVLTEQEYKVLKLLRDDVNGPFAHVWKTGEYEWDGKEAANDFWDSVPGGKLEAERRMKTR